MICMHKTAKHRWINELNKWRDILCSCIKRLSIVKVSIPLNLNKVGALTVANVKACSKATVIRRMYYCWKNIHIHQWNSIESLKLPTQIQSFDKAKPKCKIRVTLNGMQSPSPSGYEYMWLINSCWSHLSSVKCYVLGHPHNLG